MSEFVLVPIGDRKAKRLPLPVEISREGEAAITAYLAAPPEKVFAEAETVPYADPAEPEDSQAPADAPSLPSLDEED